MLAGRSTAISGVLSNCLKYSARKAGATFERILISRRLFGRIENFFENLSFIQKLSSRTLTRKTHFVPIRRRKGPMLGATPVTKTTLCQNWNFWPKTGTLVKRSAVRELSAIFDKTSETVRNHHISLMECTQLWGKGRF